MLKKVLVLAALMVFATAGPAAAQVYPPSGNGAAVSDSQAAPGEPITVQVQIFAPGSTVDFMLFSAPVSLGSAVADANGVATLTFTIPAGTEAGTHTIQATGIGIDGQPLTVTETITVAGAGGVGGSGLPTTGSTNTAPMTQIALAAMAGGGLLVLLANRRRTSKVDGRETAGV